MPADGSADLAAGILSFDVGFEEPAVGGGGQEVFVNPFRDVIVLVDRAFDEFDLEHAACRGPAGLD